jgi:glutamine amidotransferase/cyclase
LIGELLGGGFFFRFGAELIADIKGAVSIPVIASSGAGQVEHFSTCLQVARPDAVLAAGIFHRQEVPISAVKEHLLKMGYPVRALQQG